MIKAYKGFNKDFECELSGTKFKYEVGKSYHQNGVIKCCKNGFHACKNPFDVWDYFPIIDNYGNINRFAEVELSGQIDEKEDSTKIAASDITIIKELTIEDFIIVANEYLKEDISDLAKVYNSGDYAKIGSSGNSAQIGSSGYSAQIGSLGYCAQIGSLGDYAKIGSLGYCAKISSEGKYSVIQCAGESSMVKGKIGSWITLAEWKFNEKKGMNIPIHVVTKKIDGVKIKEDTFYVLVGGKFKEVEE